MDSRDFLRVLIELGSCDYAVSFILDVTMALVSAEFLYRHTLA